MKKKTVHSVVRAQSFLVGSKYLKNIFIKLIGFALIGPL